jgi:hypothetical protein
MMHSEQSHPTMLAQSKGPEPLEGGLGLEDCHDPL